MDEINKENTACNQITKETLDRIRALAKDVPPKVWKIGHTTKDELKNRQLQNCAAFSFDIDNALYIAAAKPDFMLALVDEIERLRAENARLEKEAGWLAENGQSEDKCPFELYFFKSRQVAPPPWCKTIKDSDGDHLCDGDFIKCWREAAKKAVEAN